MRVGLMTPGFSSGDAVGNDLLGMFTALMGRGDEPFVFTPTGEADFAFPVLHYADAEFVLDGQDDVLIYHYCVADPPAMAVLRRLRCRVVIRYHNVTPASMMSRYSAEFGRTCRIGRTMLDTLPDMAVDGFVAASAYSAAELVGLGIDEERVHVVPPLHRSEDLLGQPDDAATERLLEASTYNVLAVGRLVPNKGFDLMVESFSKALAWGSLDIHLHHVGHHDPRLQSFIDKVGAILGQYGARHKFTFHGTIGPRALATLYRRCDLFWTTSLHEGFCVPAVEAMTFGLPILSSRHAALPETCGDAAAYANSIDDHAVRLHEILSDDLARAAMGRRSRARYEALFRPGALKRRFLEALDATIRVAERLVPAASLDRSGDWFGLPRHEALLEAALPAAPELPPYGLVGRDRRLDLVDWALRDGPSASAQLAEYARSPDLLEYARELEMPDSAGHFSPAMRLVWTFHRPARSRFDLHGPAGASDFWRWYEREGARLYPAVTGSIACS